jgi:hypothetical protein
VLLDRCVARPNATAGALRRLPPSDKKCVDGYVTQDQQQHQITKLVRLKFFFVNLHSTVPNTSLFLFPPNSQNFAAYQLLGSSGDTSHIQQLQKLQHWGFAVAPEFMQTSDMVQCIDYFQAMEVCGLPRCSFRKFIFAPAQARFVVIRCRRNRSQSRFTRGAKSLWNNGSGPKVGPRRQVCAEKCVHRSQRHCVTGTLVCFVSFTNYKLCYHR